MAAQMFSMVYVRCWYDAGVILHAESLLQHRLRASGGAHQHSTLEPKRLRADFLKEKVG